MRGQPVDAPERWSGLWEEARPDGSAVGIVLELITTIQGAATTLQGVTQFEWSLNVGVFTRHGPEIEQGEASYFTDEYFLQVNQSRLRIRLNERADDSSTVSVDLRYDEKGKYWIGYIRRGDFADRVSPRRPHVPPGVRESVFVGTWASATPTGLGCVHIVQHRDGGLTGWSDGLQTPGLARYANGLKPPVTSFERYGNRVKVAQVGTDLFSIEFNAYGGVCCSRTMFARVQGRTAQFFGDAPDGGVEWKKMRGETCRSALQPQWPGHP